MSGNVASEQWLGVGGGLYLGHSNFSLSMAKLSQVWLRSFAAAAAAASAAAATAVILRAVGGGWEAASPDGWRPHLLLKS